MSLAGMDAEIDFIGFERGLDFLGKQALAADVAERGVGQSVAARW